MHFNKSTLAEDNNKYTYWLLLFVIRTSKTLAKTFY